MVDPPAQLLKRQQVGLLGDQHRRPRVCFAELDQPSQGVRLDRGAVECQPRLDARRPLVGGYRRQLVE